MKRLLLTLLLLSPMLAQAYDVSIGGIYYNLVSKAKSAEVTYKTKNNIFSPSYSGSVAIPATIIYDGIEYSVTSIGESAFSYCEDLISITIPNSITSIGELAFANCGLTAVHISDIAAWCKIRFSGSIMGYSNPLSCAHHLFMNGEEVKDLIIPTSVTSIGDNAFEGCSGLTSITIPNSVTSIGEKAFYDCRGLTYVAIPNSVTSIGSNVFQDCTGLKSITIPNSVPNIARGAFYGCTSLTSITIPNSVTNIGWDAFYGCTGLKSITIPNSVTWIWNTAFYGCI